MNIMRNPKLTARVNVNKIPIVNGSHLMRYIRSASFMLIAPKLTWIFVHHVFMAKGNVEMKLVRTKTVKGQYFSSLKTLT